MKSTLLITTYNRGHLLRNSLQRLKGLSLPNEVLVVDDGGTDNTQSVVDGFKHCLPIRYLYNYNPGYTSCCLAKNIGIRNTDADVIITSDPEVLFMTDIVKQMMTAHQASPNNVLATSVVYRPTKDMMHPDMITDPIKKLQAESVWFYDSQWQFFREDYAYCKTVSDQTYIKTEHWGGYYCTLFRRDWLLEINGWDEVFVEAERWEHVDLVARLRAIGHDFSMRDDMAVFHQWHPRPFIASQFDKERLFSKGFHQIESLECHHDLDKNNSNIVANRSVEWGLSKSNEKTT